jgi:hypothetical protein
MVWTARPHPQHDEVHIACNTMANVEADAAASAIGTANAHAVLFSLDLWLELWRWLDRDSKAALRGVSIAMRGQVDGSIEVVASPACGFSPDALSTALLLWPRVTHLTLLAVSDADDLTPLATTALARLTSLTVREVGGHASVAWARRMGACWHALSAVHTNPASHAHAALALHACQPWAMACLQ